MDMLHMERLSEGWMWLKMTEGSEGLVGPLDLGAPVWYLLPRQTPRDEGAKGPDLRGSLGTLLVEEMVQ